MTEYIERTDAMNAVLVGDVDKDFPCMDIAARLHDIPAADVRPVVRGKWIKIKYRSICRDCRFRGFASWNFCPNCGADMRGDQDV